MPIRSREDSEHMIAAYKNYHEVLGLARTASQDEIRVAYRKLARQFHPDVADNKELGEEILKEINEAYAVLSRPRKRIKTVPVSRTNRRHGGFTSTNRRERPSNRWEKKEEKEPARPTKPRSEFEDYLGSFFDSYDNLSSSARKEPRRNSYGSSPYHTYAQRGLDIETNLELSLKEVVTGVDRTISVSQTDPLTGELKQLSVHLRIKPGLQEGQIVCLAGRGNAGTGGGGRGDLILRVRFARNTNFRVRGLDLYREIDISPWVAAFGGYATVKTVTGTVSLKVPARIRNGQTLRIRGRGLVNDQGRSGDMYVRVSRRFHFATVTRTISFFRRKLTA